MLLYSWHNIYMSTQQCAQTPQKKKTQNWIAKFQRGVMNVHKL